MVPKKRDETYIGRGSGGLKFGGLRFWAQGRLKFFRRVILGKLTAAFLREVEGEIFPIAIWDFFAGFSIPLRWAADAGSKGLGSNAASAVSSEVLRVFLSQ